jgi:quercetin dioxygenase-like cupin family protein
MEQIKNIAAKQLMEGIIGHYAHGKNMSFGFVEITKGTIMPKHQHVHEQKTYIIEGQLDMNIGGVDYSLTPGSYFVIPSNVLHGANAITDCKVIDVFGPVREEYK